MSKSRKAEKRQARKDKKRQELEKKLNSEKVKFDILELLKTEQLDTKPNMAKFLKTYVQSISGFNSTKIQFYPTFSYNIVKIFIKFLDGHELIYDTFHDGKFAPIYYLYDYLDEVKLSNAELGIIQKFFEQLLAFKFISNIQSIK